MAQDAMARTTKRRSKLGARDRYLGILMVVPVLLFMVLLVGYPLVNLFSLSFQRVNFLTRASSFVKLDNFVDILSGAYFWQTLVRTLVYTLGTLLPCTILGTVIALIVNQKLVARSIVRSFLIFPYLVPTVVATAVFKFMFNDLLGILNHWLMQLGIASRSINIFGDIHWAMFGVIMVSVWKFTPMMMIAVLGKLQTIPSQLYEAARIDGANAWQCFWHITFPHILSVLSVVMLMRSIWLFNKWDMVYLLTGGGPLDRTTTMPLLLYNEAFGAYNLGKASAVGVIMFLLLILLSRVYYKIHQKAQDNL